MKALVLLMLGFLALAATSCSSRGIALPYREACETPTALANPSSVGDYLDAVSQGESLIGLPTGRFLQK